MAERLGLSDQKMRPVVKKIGSGQLTVREAAKQLKVSTSNVYWWCRKFGLRKHVKKHRRVFKKKPAA